MGYADIEVEVRGEMLCCIARMSARSETNCYVVYVDPRDSTDAVDPSVLRRT